MTDERHESAASDPGTDDRTLMARVQAGDGAALACLMNRWEVPTKSVIARLVLNATEAEELAQETFVRVWEQREKYRAGAEFRPWLFAIAVNLARNRLRWWRRRPTVSLDEWTAPAGREARGAPEVQRANPADGSIAPDARFGASAMECEERAAAVRDAIATLPTELREALVLFEYEEMSQAEIAAVVGATPKAVETRIHRAKEKLRSALRSWL